MSDLSFNSAGVNAREIDLSGPSAVSPSGTPGGFIGTATQGKAFVPVTVATFRDFIAKFGTTDGKAFGPLAVNEWLKNSQSATYVRVLGVGDGKRRTTSGNNAGMVTNAGFVAGQELPLATGIVGGNIYANSNGVLGRTHFLGCYMSESAGSTYFSDAGIQSSFIARPIIRGVILAASGVVPMLSGGYTPGSSDPGAAGIATAAGPNGAITGTINMISGKQDFVLLFNGLKGSATYPRIVTASFDVDSANYFANVLNTDPLKIQEAGHLLYSYYDIHPAIAVPTASGIFESTASFKLAGYEDTAFLTTSSLGRNVGSSTIPNFESFQDRFQAAASPYVISQRYGGSPKNLFKIHALSDGVVKFKISIQNIAKSSSPVDEYGSFDVLVRSLSDTDDNKQILEQFIGVNLNPGSNRFIAKVIGDQNVYYDFDKNEGNQKLVSSGKFPNMSNIVRVQMSDRFEAGEVPSSALPVGFRGFKHLITSGSSILASSVGFSASYAPGQTSTLVRAIIPPVPMRKNIKVGVTPSDRSDGTLYWGVQFEKVASTSEMNKIRFPDTSIESYTKYMPSFSTSWQKSWVGDNEGTADSAGTIFDADRFNNNMFTLENIQVRTGSNGIVDSKEWVSASYFRQGGVSTSETNKTRPFSVAIDLADVSVRNYAKFSFFVQGGFDGHNIFDESSTRMTNTAVKQEMDDTTGRGGAQGPTVRAYRKALDIMGERTSADIAVLAVPGLRHSVVTDYAISITENQRFDAIYIMDVEERDSVNTVVTSSSQTVSVTNTVNAFGNRGLDSSFAAAYFPDTIIQDPQTLTNVQCPPSVAVVGAIALNDAVAHPWFAPAGFTRGALNSTIETSVGLTRGNLDSLYQVDINPITAFPGSSGVVVWGQKTLKATQSALDRVNVRRLLIDVRRQVKAVSDLILFEPNREATLSRFRNLVNPILKRIQDNSGIDRFKLILDTTTTTEADIQNNTIRGKLFLQPTKSIEFISIDLVVTNAGSNL